MVSKDFCGTCALKDLPKGVFFRVVKKDGSTSKETYFKDYYERSLKKYSCSKCSDIWGNGRFLNGSTIITTDFIY